jgi:hypothetical protein
MFFEQRVGRKSARSRAVWQAEHPMPERRTDTPPAWQAGVLLRTCKNPDTIPRNDAVRCGTDASGTGTPHRRHQAQNSAGPIVVRTGSASQELLPELSCRRRAFSGQAEPALGGRVISQQRSRLLEHISAVHRGPNRARSQETDALQCAGEVQL